MAHRANLRAKQLGSISIFCENRIVTIRGEPHHLRVDGPVPGGLRNDVHRKNGLQVFRPGNDGWRIGIQPWIVFYGPGRSLPAAIAPPFKGSRAAAGPL